MEKRFPVGSIVKLVPKLMDFAAPKYSRAMVQGYVTIGFRSYSSYSEYVDVKWIDAVSQMDGGYFQEDFELAEPLSMSEQITRKFLDAEV